MTERAAYATAYIVWFGALALASALHSYAVIGLLIATLMGLVGDWSTAWPVAFLAWLSWMAGDLIYDLMTRMAGASSNE